ncbi:class I SAM-dependent methyltransferase [Flavobacterium sp. ANB]|uniref:class I SAM-dependent methyltransferase n=1 Tax=unclassified Flavobacterium TaxID=196869 RepID=UPI0012B6C1A2|nr:MULTISPECIES: class I SAM-dependent methyltransferase [unclassified Flavobacterium]MBF4517845.1 class I SAM-dependent methyltransferase [Flavobacterium sp. ANB]MTD72085.1 class I SAM-dependent methyltransferase [Flavobacterium sp. LC2016-13]
MTDKSQLRSSIFRHLDGLAVAPVAIALKNNGVLEFILNKKQIQLAELTTAFKANEGYLNVGLRILASQGFLDYEVDNGSQEIVISVNEKTETAFSLFHLYEDVVDLLKFSTQFHPRIFEDAPFEKLNLIFEKYKKNYGIEKSEDNLTNSIQDQILKHIEGYLIGPTVVRLAMNGMFHKYFMETSFRPEEFHKSPENFKKILDFFVHLGWFLEKNGNYQFTEVGLFYAKRASAYGVTVSYLPTFAKIEDLIFGDPAVLRMIADGENEIHVDREMNVWGSGGAHDTYFKVVDEILVKLFNLPIEEQPKGILDMGCGNGAFLQHIFEVIDRQTLRGKMLNEYPLFLVGADYNQTALKVTRANLIKADIWAKVIWGDIGNPNVLSDDLKENYNIDLKDLLNVRTFLDHNRIWENPKHIDKNRISKSTGAFAYRGKRISNNLVEDNLLEHLQKWSPYVSKFGLLLIELHTVNPKLTANNLGKTPATAYDATHGFSDQYIIETDVFNSVAAEAGLFPDPAIFRRFPDADIATVSINLLKGN